jgi:hypothetical protein
MKTHNRHAHRADIPVYRGEREGLVEISTSKASERVLWKGEIRADSANAPIYW